MLKAKINVNGIEWNLTGDKEDIVYALRNATSTSIPTEKQIIDKVPAFINHEIVHTPNKLMSEMTKGVKFSKDNVVKMYQWLASHGNYTIKQFEITRGGKINPTQYTVCLVFDENKQRYCWYNPKTEDTFLKSFSISDVITRIKNAESGFSLLHTVANRISEKMGVVEVLTKILSKTNTNVEPKSYYTGIVKVMKKNEWLTAKQIWNRMVNAGFTSNGKTPAATIASKIYVDIKNNGINSIFEREPGKQSFRVKS